MKEKVGIVISNKHSPSHYIEVDELVSIVAKNGNIYDCKGKSRTSDMLVWQDVNAKDLEIIGYL